MPLAEEVHDSLLMCSSIPSSQRALNQSREHVLGHFTWSPEVFTTLTVCECRRQDRPWRRSSGLWGGDSLDGSSCCFGGCQHPAAANQPVRRKLPRAQDDN